VVSYILILKVFLVNLLAALNFANVFLKIKERLENKKRKKRDQNKKKLKNVFTSVLPTNCNCYYYTRVGQP